MHRITSFGVRSLRQSSRAMLLVERTDASTGRQSLVRALSSSSIPSGSESPTAWKWVPPPARPQQTLEEEAANQTRESLPKSSPAKPISVIKGVHLTADEVMDAFTRNGAENLSRKPCGQMADAMVFATAKSSTHARMLAELVVKATKERRLKMYNPSKPIEGEDDWFLVDTGKLLIHVFGDQEFRDKVGLEAHLDALLRRKKQDARLDRLDRELDEADDEDDGEKGSDGGEKGPDDVDGLEPHQPLKSSSK